MKYNKKLDLILNKLVKYNLDKNLPASCFHLNTNPKEISIIELSLILNKLEKDGYIERSTIMTNEFFITFDGKVFIENNGYVKQSRKKFFNRFEKFIWMILGTILAAITIIIERLIDLHFPS